VSQGGLIWSPVWPAQVTDTWANSNAYCTGATMLGLTGWRLPTTLKLGALYSSTAMNGQGWTLFATWSSVSQAAGFHDVVYLNDGTLSSVDTSFNVYFMTCVR
jgi:hypothetical protein